MVARSLSALIAAAAQRRDTTNEAVIKALLDAMRGALLMSLGPERQLELSYENDRIEAWQVMTVVPCPTTINELAVETAHRAGMIADPGDELLIQLFWDFASDRQAEVQDACYGPGLGFRMRGCGARYRVLAAAEGVLFPKPSPTVDDPLNGVESVWWETLFEGHDIPPLADSLRRLVWEQPQEHYWALQKVMNATSASPHVFVKTLPCLCALRDARVIPQRSAIARMIERRLKDLREEHLAEAQRILEERPDTTMHSLPAEATSVREEPKRLSSTERPPSSQVNAAKVAQPASATEVRKSKMQWLENHLRIDIHAGFLSWEEVIDATKDRVADELPGDATAGEELSRLARAEWAAQEARQATWRERSVNDAIDDAFAELNKSGIVALQNAGYTQSDAWDDCFQRGEEMRARGAVFFHGQDVERGVAGDGLRLGFGAFAFDQQEERDRAIGHEICEALCRHGIPFDWNGDISTRIRIPAFEWRKRR